jgi:glycosyltransferase involved in cell wall biosynthesis
MKIGIDVSQVVYGTGVSRYTSNLVKNLLELNHEDQFVLFGGSLRKMDTLRSYYREITAKNVKKILAPISPSMADFIWNRVHRFKIEKVIGNIDIFHTSDWTEPPTKALKVTTVHDLAPIKFPKLTAKRIVEVHTQKLEWVKKESRAIFVPSETIKNDLIQLDFNGDIIYITPEAADYSIASRVEVDKTKKKYGIRKNYLLSVGVGYRKNTDRILEAYKEIKKDIDLELVLVGNSGNYKSDEGVIVTGFVSDNELSALYTGADVLVYPSMYEGFGIPILDAFNCKIPVVTSNVGSMREIGEGAAVWVVEKGHHVALLVVRDGSGGHCRRRHLVDVTKDAREERYLGVQLDQVLIEIEFRAGDFRCIDGTSVIVDVHLDRPHGSTIPKERLLFHDLSATSESSRPDSDFRRAPSISWEPQVLLSRISPERTLRPLWHVGRSKRRSCVSREFDRPRPSRRCRASDVAHLTRTPTRRRLV